jgi:hypothetical protein
VVGVSMIVSYLLKTFLYTDALVYSSLAEQLTAEKIESMLEQMHKWKWVSYIFKVISYSIKFLLISFVLLTGFFFFDQKVSFLVLFKAVVLAETPFVLIPLIKLYWFLFVQTNYNLDDLKYFHPLSALQLFEIKNLATWQIYPLQLFNVFELIYWIVLTYWLKKLLNISFNKIIEVVASSYGLSLLLWVVFITFLSLNLG